MSLKANGVTTLLDVLLLQLIDSLKFEIRSENLQSLRMLGAKGIECEYVSSLKVLS